MSDSVPITIVAKRSPNDGGDDDTGFIAGITQRLARSNPVFASNMLDVKQALVRAKDTSGGKPLSVQIVGHGLPGQLLLGMTWMQGADIAARARAFPFSVIDTSPLALTFFHDLIGSISDLTLAGCHVGDPDVSGTGWSINGRSLTYCLAELLKCQVSGAIGFVGTSDFDDTGRFIGDQATWAPDKNGALQWSTKNSKPTRPTTKPEFDVGITEVSSTYLVAHSKDSHEVPLIAARVAPLVERYDDIAMATPELNVATTVDGAAGTATLVGNSRFMIINGKQYAVINVDTVGPAISRIVNTSNQTPIEAVDPCTHAIVQQVQVESYADGKLTFFSRSVNNNLTKFTVPITEIMAQGPTGCPQSVSWRTPGAVGNLYLSRQGWDSLTAIDGGLFGYNTEAVLFKFPWCLPFRGIEPLAMIPTSIKVTFFDDKSQALLAVDVQPGSQIVWNGARKITFETADGSRTEWPKRIDVAGASVQYPDQKGVVDVLNCDLGDFTQQIEWKKQGAPVTLQLTENGFEAFNVIQEAIHQYAAGASVPYPGPLVDDLETLGKELPPELKKVLEAARARVRKTPGALRARGKRLLPRRAFPRKN
jgi:hypothetical protein